MKSFVLVLMLCWSSWAIGEVAVPPLSGHVVDQTMTLSQSEQASLESTLKDLEQRKGSQVAVLIVPTTSPEEIEQFSIRVADAWKIGRKKIDDGAILVIAKDDHKLRIEVGYGLEGALTDIISQRIIDEVIVPKFRTGDYSGGISDGVDRILKTIDGEPLPPPAAEPQSSYLVDHLNTFGPFLFIGVIVLGGMLRTILGRLFGSLGTGIAVSVVVWLFVGTLAASLVVGLIAFLLTLFGDLATTGGRGGFSTGGGSFSGGSSGGGGFSGGGGGLVAAARRGAGDMGIKRIGKHLLANRSRVQAAFPPNVLSAIEQAIKASESRHGGQIRFVVEGALDGAPLFRGQTARERALDVFADLRIWDTEHNNGVLIYLLLADRNVEIIADRGINNKVKASDWEAICRDMETQFRNGEYERGAVLGIEDVTRHLIEHFPKHSGDKNELPDEPVII